MANYTTFFPIVFTFFASGWPTLLDLPLIACHERCLCTLDDTEEGYVYQVQCGDQNLKSVPYTTTEVTVSLLNLSFNALKTLEEETLFKYKSVKYLYLQYCRLRHINEKAFVDLKNLFYIDLSNNRLTSLSPDLFKGNQILNTLILKYNNYLDLERNTTLLNGPASLSVLDLQSCKLSSLSPVIFSLIPNLTFLDISNNDLAVLDPHILSSHRQLENVNLENNPWKCGDEFKELVCWVNNKLGVLNMTLNCQNKNGTWEEWPTIKWSSLCGPITTPSSEQDINTSTKLNQSVTPSNKSDISTNTTLEPKTTSQKVTETESTLQRVYITLIEFRIVCVVVVVVVAVAVAVIFFVWVKCKKPHEQNRPENELLQEQSETRVLVGLEVEDDKLIPTNVSKETGL